MDPVVNSPLAGEHPLNRDMFKAQMRVVAIRIYLIRLFIGIREREAVKHRFNQDSDLLIDTHHINQAMVADLFKFNIKALLASSIIFLVRCHPIPPTPLMT
jgi:hypothetical protein